MNNNFLRSVLVGESRAYGFTIAFWGSGALLIKSFGLPALAEALAYGTGAVTGFGALSLLAFRYAFGKAEYEEPEFLVFSMLHYISALVPVIVTGHISNYFGPVASFFLGGMVVSMGYNIFMLMEKTLADEAKWLEEKLLELNPR